jgi:YbbR domain-containing protein
MPKFDSKKLLALAAKNWPAKVLSIALAIVVFLFHRMSILQERYFSSPLNVETASGMVPSSSYTHNIKVTLRGESDSIDPILDEDVQVYVDLTHDRKAGTYTLPVKVRKKGTALQAHSLEVNVSPLEVTVAIDEKISKNVPLRAAIEGKPADGYQLDSYTLNPSQVMLEGPLKAVNAISELDTDAINLDGRNEDLTLTVPILNRNSLVVIEGEGSTVFRGNISAIMEDKTSSALTISLDNTPVGFEAAISSPGLAEVQTGTITATGKKAAVEAWQPAEGDLYVDLSKITLEGVYTLPLAAKLPSGLTVKDLEPETITVIISAATGNGQKNEEKNGGEH